MQVQAAAAMHVKAMVLSTARDQVEAAQAQPVPASAPVSAHADVILSLSSAAAGLRTQD